MLHWHASGAPLSPFSSARLAGYPMADPKLVKAAIKEGGKKVRSSLTHPPQCAQQLHCPSPL